MDQLELLHKQVDTWNQAGYVTLRSAQILQNVLDLYTTTVSESGQSKEKAVEILTEYVNILQKLFEKPFKFESYHQMIREPIDYYRFGMDFTRLLVNPHASRYLGNENLEEIEKRLKANENVILLANHQTELDPHFMNLLLNKKHPVLGKAIIFVAGDRVITDPYAIPLSMGRNLLCIYSKKHITNPPEQKEQKRLHNKKTMQLMSELLAEGGKCIYVAPSGGRDRPDADGRFDVSPFDPQSIEMFYLMTKRAKTISHFYHLTLLTHRVLPPPPETEMELGEERITKYAGVYASFGNKIDMDNFPGHDHGNKINQRHKRSDYIWNLVREDYQKLKKLKDQHEDST